MKKVKIKQMVITQQYGVLSDGDILNCSDDFAKHLVDECNAGDYLELPKAEIETKEVKQKSKG